MRIIISPAKKMREDVDTFGSEGLPKYIAKTGELLAQLKSYGAEELKSLWNCSDKLVELNMGRLRNMELERAQTPALLSYEGIQYQYMAPGVFTQEALMYLKEHLRILSGFYGILRPFDAVRPYRLEMQAKLQVGNNKDLYEYWGDTIAKDLFDETDCVLNLASKEYSTIVSRHLQPQIWLITCTFAERKGNRLVEKGTLCKMARGEMVRYLAEQQVRNPKNVVAFTGLGFKYSPIDSNKNHYVFIKEER